MLKADVTFFYGEFGSLIRGKKSQKWLQNEDFAVRI